MDVKSEDSRQVAGNLAPRRPVVELVDEDVARILAAKSGAERFALAADAWRFARQVVECSVRAAHPEWDEQRVSAEVARRLCSAPG